MKTYVGWVLAGIAIVYAGYLSVRVTKLEARLGDLQLQQRNTNIELKALRKPRLEPLVFNR